MRYLILSCLFISLFLIPCRSYGQRLSKEEVLDSMRRLPAFTSYHDNFLISGIPTNHAATKENSDIKYQISFKQLISRATLPFNSYMFLSYSQKAFWNVYSKSSPFEEINFNPAIGVGTPVFDRERRIIGIAELQLEHESNGRDGIASRSWNRLTGVYHTSMRKGTILSVKGWVPFTYSEDHPDLLDYVGLGELKVQQSIISNQLIVEITGRKGLKDWKGSLGSKIYYKLFNNSGNQYLMLEWFAGYAESLIDYNKYTSMIRLGYVIKSTDLDILKTR